LARTRFQFLARYQNALSELCSQSRQHETTMMSRAEIENQMSQMQESAPTPIENMPGLTTALVQKLATSGITTAEQLADLAPEDLENIPGIGSKTVEKIKDVLSEYYAQLPSYQDDMVRAAAEHMFSKSDDEPAEEVKEEVKEETSKPVGESES